MMASRWEFFLYPSGFVALILTLLGAAFLFVGTAFLFICGGGAIAGVLSLATAAPFLGVGFVGVAIGGIALATGLRLSATIHRRMRIREQGNAVEGTIVNVEQDLNVRARGSSHHPWRIQYRYRVGKVEFKGSETWWDKPEAYVTGASVNARYDPQDPSQSALERS